MALIDFKCKKCGKEFFEIVDNNDEVVCPKCFSKNVQRLYKGKYYGKSSSTCSGNCSSCGGCH